MGGFFRRTRRDGRKLVLIGLAMFVGSIYVALRGGDLYLGPFWMLERGFIAEAEFSTVVFASPIVIIFGIVAMTGRLDPERRRKPVETGG